jgi:hypothetical protein
MDCWIMNLVRGKENGMRALYLALPSLQYSPFLWPPPTNNKALVQHATIVPQHTYAAGAPSPDPAFIAMCTHSSHPDLSYKEPAPQPSAGMSQPCLRHAQRSDWLRTETKPNLRVFLAQGPATNATSCGSCTAFRLPNGRRSARNSRNKQIKTHPHRLAYR